MSILRAEEQANKIFSLLTHAIEYQIICFATHSNCCFAVFPYDTGGQQAAAVGWLQAFPYTDNV
jgi:hypothetical protein